MSDNIGVCAHCPECHRFVGNWEATFKNRFPGPYLAYVEADCKVHGRIKLDASCCEHCEYIGGWAEAWDYDEYASPSEAKGEGE